MGNLTLFQIQQEYLELMQLIEEKEGVLDEIDMAALMINEEELVEKSVNYIGVIRFCESEIKRAKEAKEQIDTFIKRKQAVIDRLSQNLLTTVKLVGPYEAGFHKIATRKSEEVIIEKPELIAEEFLNKKEVITVDKTKIKKAIKDGKEVKGAFINEKQNLAIK
ncbi:siphovirus Gp157 family protein [Mongoliitalea daihaiensis]|uniref:siphovirus Gp157 family protein n=1 Tax=Mongoliitalea daihaiensis TaxID=2782006 RepID=UPI001F35D688|nr:siphovirus Gp157 family protein [Mongoliitalea daihaiensis]UJP64038.1 siphovirus Gp157 family protein [Mongoliitalea daihaiensis]